MSIENEEDTLTDKERMEINAVCKDILAVFMAHKAQPVITLHALRFLTSGILCVTVPREYWDEAIDALAEDLKDDCKAAAEDPNSPYNKRLRHG